MAKFSEMEYVYNFGDPFEFRKVKVETHVEENVVTLKLYPEFMMTDGELDGMLKGFQADVLDKRHIKLADDCMVIVAHGGKTYNVELAEGSRVVKRIVQA